MKTQTAKTKIRPETIHTRKEAVERVISTVNQKLDEPMSMDEMAKIAYLSPFHFSRVFHQVTGLPPTQFLYALRLEAAKRLLLTTKRSVTDICYEVGYNSLGTFTSRFTELVGLSPREFRRLAKKVSSFDWEGLFAEGWKTFKVDERKPLLKGTIDAPENFKGLVFIGLFEQMIPQARPITGTLLTRGGDFSLGAVPPGNYHLLVAALPHSADPINYLLLDLKTLLVGIYEETLTFEEDSLIESVSVNIRPLQLTDPPILTALPFLLTEGISNLTNR